MVIGRLTLATPAGVEGRPVCAAVRQGGRVVARGLVMAGSEGNTDLELRAMNPAGGPPVGKAELVVSLNRDALVAPDPSYGDLYIRAELNGDGTPWHFSVADPKLWREHKPSDPGNVVTVHYRRYDGDYDDVGLWTWDLRGRLQPARNEHFEVGRTPSGLVFQFDRAEYGSGTADDAIGLLPRVAGDWNRKDGPDRIWQPVYGRDVFIVSGRAELRTEPPPSGPHVVNAFVDDATTVHVTLSHPVSPADARPDRITLTVGRNEAVVRPSQVVVKTPPGREVGSELELKFARPLRLAARGYILAISGFEQGQVIPRGLLDDPALFSDIGARLGLEYSRESSTFRVFAPTATNVALVLYDRASGSEGRSETDFKSRDAGVWEVTVPGNLNGLYYAYRLEGPGLDPRKEIVDVYAHNAVDSGLRARVTDLAATNPPRWVELRQGPRLKRPTDAVIYEMHVRDFSVSPTSGVAPERRGKYLGFAQAGTRLPSDPSVSTTLDHLAELGVTHVQLLPVQDFANNEASDAYNWGYITVNFNSPEGQYATSRFDASRVLELKSLIAALHERGIGVILDVVYNHTGPGAAFDAIVPGYYYRRTPEGHLYNSSGVGNDFRSEAPMGRKFIVDSLKFWVREYGVDGFRFDLMALIDEGTMAEAERELRKLNPDILIYGEPWAAGAPSTPHPTDKGVLRRLNVGVFNDEFRNNLKGSPDGGGWGFIQGLGNRDAVHHGLEGTVKSWVPRAGQTVNYLTCHDNLVLFDKLKASHREADDARIMDMMSVGHLLMICAHGVPFLHGGEEFARTKHGHHNSYDAGDAVNQVDWTLKRRNHRLFEWTRDLIAFRKAHPVLRIDDPELITSVLKFPPSPNPHAVIAHWDASEYFEEPVAGVVLLANGSPVDAARFTLPPGRWEIALDSRRGRGPAVAPATVELPPSSGMLLVQPRVRE
jgi:pullulanase